MPNEVKTIIKIASNSKKQERKKIILKDINMCINTFQDLENRIKKLIEALAIN